MKIILEIRPKNDGVSLKVKTRTEGGDDGNVSVVAKSVMTLLGRILKSGNEEGGDK